MKLVTCIQMLMYECSILTQIHSSNMLNKIVLGLNDFLFDSNWYDSKRSDP